MIAGDKIKCRTSVGYYTLTEGKVYECLYGLEEGIFSDRPFVTVIGDNGKEVGAHASRFEIVEETK
jgi:hypothetical protein